MAKFDEISGKLDTLDAGQVSAATSAAEIQADIVALKAVVDGQTGADGLSAGQTTAISARLDEIAAKSATLQAALAGSAAEYNSTPPVDPPQDPPVDPVDPSARGRRR